MKTEDQIIKNYLDGFKHLSTTKEVLLHIRSFYFRVANDVLLNTNVVTFRCYMNKGLCRHIKAFYIDDLIPFKHYSAICNASTNLAFPKKYYMDDKGYTVTRNLYSIELRIKLIDELLKFI